MLKMIASALTGRRPPSHLPPALFVVVEWISVYPDDGIEAVYGPFDTVREAQETADSLAVVFEFTGDVRLATVHKLSQGMNL